MSMLEENESEFLDFKQNKPKEVGWYVVICQYQESSKFLFDAYWNGEEFRFELNTKIVYSIIHKFYPEVFSSSEEASDFCNIVEMYII